MTKINHTLRASKGYTPALINNMLAEFVPIYLDAMGVKPENVEYIEFAKQDMRGLPSICLFTKKGTVSSQKAFLNYALMLAFIEGVIFSKRGW